MELLGDQLRDKVRKGRAIKVETVARIGSQMVVIRQSEKLAFSNRYNILQLLALRFLHEHGIVHRDVKPGNIMLCHTDPTTLRLIDFSLAKRFPTSSRLLREGIEQEPAIGIALGTINYASLNAYTNVGE
jgi:serine/threonine protein kinase